MPPRLLDNVPTSPNRERTPLQNGLAMEPYANEGLNSTPAASGASTAPAVFGFTTAAPLFSNTTASSSSPLTAATTTKVASAPSMFSNTSAATSSSKCYLSYPFGPSCSAPTQACDSVSVMHPSVVPSTMAGAAPKVFGEMPTPISWQGTHGTAPDYCLGHHNLIPSSCASNLSEQNLDGKPQPYGFHNLNRHSVLLADGTKRSYYALPENYSLERATSSTSPAIPTVEVSDTYQSFIPPLNDQISEKQTHPGIGIGEMMAQIQEKLKTISENLSRDLKRMESRESKQSAATQASGLAPVCCSKTHNTVGSETMPQSYLLEQATSEPLFSNDPVDVSASTLEQQPDEEKQHADVQDCTIELQQKDDESSCNYPVIKASDSSATRSSQLSLEHSMSELRMLWDPGASASLHSSKANLCNQLDTYGISTDLAFTTQVMRNYLNAKFSVPMVQNAIQRLRYGFAINTSSLCNLELMSNTSSKVEAFIWRKSVTGTPFILLSSTTYTWDPGVLNILEMMLDKYTVPNKVQFIQRTTEISFLSLTVCIQYMVPNGINSVAHDTSFILPRAAHLSHSKYLCSWYCNSMQKTEYCCLWKFSVSCEKCMQWNPGVPVMLHSYTETHPLVTHTGVCTHMRQPIFSSPVMCYFAFDRRWTVVNTSVLFVLAIQYSTGRSVAKPFLFLLTDDNSGTNYSFPKMCMHSLHTTTAVQVTIRMHTLEFHLMDLMLQKESEFRNGQLTCMPQSATIHSSEFPWQMVNVLSRWFPSFEMVKLQWDPGIQISSSIYLWLPGLTVRIANEKPLSWLPIPELTKWQSQVTGASFVWDPGTMLLQYKPKWWLLFIQEKISGHNNIKFYGIALWMINFQPP